jgi:undecaprenyl-phosphate galactose phosphotransferase
MSAVEELRLEPASYSDRWVAPLSVAGSGAKRLLDVFGALILLIPAIPVVLILGLLVAADGGLPIYRDKRYGRNGVVFECLKIRTMHKNAEKLLAEHLAKDEAARLEWTTDFKLRDDPRVTRLGKFLRKSGLDELPQLWNVLRGEMSLVGPRPIPCSHGEEELYGRYIAHYYRVKPGLTGLWQVCGRNDVPYRTRIAMVVYYVRHWSIMMDIAILIRTVGVVLTARGGY